MNDHRIEVSKQVLTLFATRATNSKEAKEKKQQ